MRCCRPCRSQAASERRKPGDVPNLAHLFVGSEGTLATFTRLHLRLSPIVSARCWAICHFPTFYGAMDAAQHIVKSRVRLAVELVDRNMIDLGRSIPMFRDTTNLFVRGEPAALLMVEFAEEDDAANLRQLRRLAELMGDLGLRNSVVEAIDPAFQAAIWSVRTEGLNIMMSMRDERKPVSFIEDTAVPLEHLAEFTQTLTELFARHGTTGTWYAHASEGCLHVRPVLNLKLDLDVKRMRAIAEETFALIRAYKGSHSGEHGDGLVRSEFNPAMFGPEITTAHKAIKRRIDPAGRLNPGKIVDAPKMDDRTLFRFKPGYAVAPIKTAFDWSAWGGIGQAAEMCNNNGACRKLTGGVMCPSYRVTRNERDLTRGRANSLRLALSGQLGPEAMASDEMAKTMELCVSCKGCRSECPTGVDMARFKIESQAKRAKAKGLSIRDRAVGYLPRYAAWLSRLALVVNAAAALPGVSHLVRRALGFSTRRSLPHWRRAFDSRTRSVGPAGGVELVLLADTFNRHFNPEIIEAAIERARGRWMPGAPAWRGKGQGAPLLWAHDAFRRSGGTGARRGATRRRRLAPIRRPPDSHRRPGAILPSDPARRICGSPAWRRYRSPGRQQLFVRRVSGGAVWRMEASPSAWRRLATMRSSCTAIATKRRFPLSGLWKRFCRASRE